MDMANFRSGGRRGFGDKSGGRSSGGFGRRSEGGFRDRDSERSSQKYDAVCAKCGKKCQVPFKPTGTKPVLCSDCFRQSAGSGDRSIRMASPGISPGQINEINGKLDMIIKLLKNLEIDESEDDEPNKSSDADSAAE
jgi:CxxC-x17-CxxC domain-containing protein